MTRNLRKPKMSSTSVFSRKSNTNRQTGSLDLSKETENQSRQVGARTKDAGSKFKTPQTKKKSTLIPIAPKKKQKPFNKFKLLPKKLIYSDEEMLCSDEEDSGIKMNFVDSDNRILRSHTNSGKTQLNVPTKNQSKPNNKENNKKPTGTKIVDNKIKSTGNNVLATKSSIDTPKRSDITQYSKPPPQRNFNPNDIVQLSQCDENLNWHEKIRWLQPRRDVGLWVQCCRKTCAKWRYCEEYHDPLDVPTIWFCEMNLDKRIASCNIPEVEISPGIKCDLIENKYNAGSIVWAKVNYFPWWPAMIDDCPEMLQYYDIYADSCIPYKYHVIFFNESKLERAWITLKYLKPFVTTDKQSFIEKAIMYNIDYTVPLEKAYNLAVYATKLSILERLKKFSYLSRYEVLYGNQIPIANICHDNNNNLTPISHYSRESKGVSDSHSTDIIPCSQNSQHHMLLRNYYNVFLSRKFATNVQ